jgi:hypothetical protein
MRARIGAAFRARGAPAKFRQAAIVYLLVGILYEMAVFVAWRKDILPEARGPAEIWLLIGAFFALGIPYALWRWQHRWFALLLLGLGALRLPALIEGAFFDRAHTGVDAAVIPSGFYLTALVVVVINLALLARAGFDV